MSEVTQSTVSGMDDMQQEYTQDDEQPSKKRRRYTYQHFPFPFLLAPQLGYYVISQYFPHKLSDQYY